MNAALKRAIFASAVGFAVALAASCGGNNNNNNNPPTCDATSCPTGCCDSTGTCQLGTSGNACGKGGGQCLTCLTTQTCSNQVCTAGTGGGAGGGSGGGSGGGAGGGAGGGGGATLVGDAGVDALLAACSSGKTAYCSYLARCGFGSTLAGLCEEAIDRGDIYVNTCTDLQLQVSIQQGRVGVDTALLQSCTAALATAPCDRAILNDNGPFGTVCKNALVPKVAVGGQCTYSGLQECVNGFCDTENGATCPSTCQPRIALRGDAGDAFVGFDPTAQFNPCADGLYPYDTGGSNVAICVPYADAGTSCAPTPDNGFDNQLCAPGSWCDVTVTENCLPVRGADAGCESDEECGPDLMCNDFNCTPLLPGTGTVCSDSSTFECKVGLFCDVSLATAKCIAPKAAGAVCDEFNFDADCRTANYCADQNDGGFACAAKKTSGSCPNGGECAAGYFCDGTFTCKPLSGLDGGACSFDFDCQPGLACDANDTCVLPYSCP